MNTQFYYIDPQGKRWNLTGVQPSDTPNFYRGIRAEDGQKVTIHRNDLRLQTADEPANK